MTKSELEREIETLKAQLESKGNKGSNMVEVVFTEDCRSKKKNETRLFSPDVARGLVVVSRVAKYTDDKRQKKASDYIKKVDALKKKRLAEEEAKRLKHDKRYAKLKADEKLLEKKKANKTTKK